MKKFIVITLLIISPVYAQSQPVTPADATLRAINIITQLGQLSQSQEIQIKELNNQIAELKKQLEEKNKK